MSRRWSSGAEPSVDRAARERRFQKSCAGAEPFHRHLEDAIGYRRHQGRRNPCRSVPARPCPRPTPDRPWRPGPSPRHGGCGRRRDRHSPPGGRRPHRRCTAGSACRHPNTCVPRRESRAPTGRTCHRRTGTWRSCETGSATAARRSDAPLRSGPAYRTPRTTNSEQVDAFPAHRQLDHPVQFAQCHGVRHEDAAPDHRADSQQPNLELQNRPWERCRLHRLHGRKLPGTP